LTHLLPLAACYKKELAADIAHWRIVPIAISRHVAFALALTWWLCLP
jgi:hypothetical protein